MASPIVNAAAPAWAAGTNAPFPLTNLHPAVLGFLRALGVDPASGQVQSGPPAMFLKGDSGGFGLAGWGGGSGMSIPEQQPQWHPGMKGYFGSTLKPGEFEPRSYQPRAVQLAHGLGKNPNWNPDANSFTPGRAQGRV